ncbi:MAG: hypothetical protein IJB59_06035 [Oscillospiraceae bacterium]|nr:hypothetical protein [Oscillospiraceae bacterium]
MKKFIALFLVLVCVLDLAGCSLFYDQELQEEISEIIDESDVQLVTKTYHHLQEINIEYANGDTCKLIYSYPEAANHFLKDYIGCTVFENGQQVCSEEYVRDDKDNIISVVGDSTTTFGLTYDKNDRIIAKVISVDGIEQGYEEYSFNAQGQLTEVIVYENNKRIQRIVTEYDENGRRTRITRYDRSENVISYDVCEFDLKRYKEKVMQYDVNGALLGYQWNSYDLYDLVLVEEDYDASDNLLSTTTWKYQSGEITYDAAKGLPNT